MLSIHYRRMCQWVCGNTQPHRSVCRLRPVPPSISASTRWRLLFVPPVCMCVREGGSKFYTPQMSVRREGVRVSVSVPKSPELLKPYPDSGFLSEAVSASCGSKASRWRSRRASQPQWPLLTEALWCLSPFERVCVCVSVPLLLSFLGGSPCSVCLPSLSAGRARNLRHRNF